jgi:secretion/DNA translocation related TadE-like protein
MATVLACICAMALIGVSVLALRLGAATVARGRAETAADLGALAGAVAVLNGERAACDAASTVVAANGGTIESCLLRGADVQVVVSMEVAIGPVTRQAEARARAGPVAAQSP